MTKQQRKAGWIVAVLIAACTFAMALAILGCSVAGRYSIDGPFGKVSFGAEGDQPYDLEVEPPLVDALADRIRKDEGETPDEETP